MESKTFITWNAVNSVPQAKKSDTETYISVSTNGQIRFSPALAEKLALQVGSRVAFLQGTENPKEWCLVTDDKEGLPVRCHVKYKKYYTNGKLLVSEIMKVVNRSRNVRIRVCAAPEMGKQQGVPVRVFYRMYVNEVK